MRARSTTLATICLSALLAVASAHAADRTVGEPGDRGWRCVLAGGRLVESCQVAGKMSVTFIKPGDERRLLAFEAPVECEGKILSSSFPYEIGLEMGTARLAVVASENDGDTWFKLAKNTLPSNATAEAGVSLTGMTRAAFSSGDGGEVQWDQVNRIQVGLVIDGPAEGTFAVGTARLSDQPYRATRVRDLESPARRQWRHSADPAAQVKLSTCDEGPGGTECWQFDFAFPGGRHMFAVPATAFDDVVLSAYRSLEITYRAQLPEGIPGLLLMFIERDGTQYCAEPPPPPTDKWKTLTVPLKGFKRGTWSEDENDRLDLDGVASMAVAVHGVAKPVKAEGTVWVSRLRLLP